MTQDSIQILDLVDLAARASRPLSTIPRPFLRWAGSKQRLLAQLVPLLPRTTATYYEPFLGAGAMYWLLRPNRAVLNDACEPLIATYNAVKRDHGAVVEALSKFDVTDSELYYRVRREIPQTETDRAARFIYLNRAAWNGLYRVNSKGEFNVPYGRPRSAHLVNVDLLRHCSEHLQASDTRLSSGDFEAALTSATSGDVVYLDPPYVTGHNGNGFVDYNESLFSWDDQERLARVARDLVNRGVWVMVSNANHKAIRDLYYDFKAIEISRTNSISGDVSARSRVTELALVGGG